MCLVLFLLPFNASGLLVGALTSKKNFGKTELQLRACYCAPA